MATKNATSELRRGNSQLAELSPYSKATELSATRPLETHTNRLPDRLSLLRYVCCLSYYEHLFCALFVVVISVWLSVAFRGD